MHIIHDIAHFGVQLEVLCDNYSHESYTLVISKMSSGVVIELVVFPGIENVLQADKLVDNGVYKLVVNVSTDIGHVSTSPRKLCK